MNHVSVSTPATATPYQLQLHRERREREARIRRAAIAEEFKRNERRLPVLVPRALLMREKDAPPRPPAPPLPVYVNNAKLTIATVARHFGITSDELIGKSREHRFVWPRQVSAYLLRVTTNRSMPQIGRLLGGRDHTTALHAHRKVYCRSRHDLRLFLQIDALRRQIVGEPPLAGLLPPPRLSQACQLGTSAQSEAA